MTPPGARVREHAITIYSLVYSLTSYPESSATPADGIALCDSGFNMKLGRFIREHAGRVLEDDLDNFDGWVAEYCKRLVS